MPVVGCRVGLVILQDNGEELFRTQRVRQPGAVSMDFVMNAAIETVQAETDAWNASRNGYPNDYLPSVRPANPPRVVAQEDFATGKYKVIRQVAVRSGMAPWDYAV